MVKPSIWLLFSLFVVLPDARASVAFPQAVRDEWGVPDLGVRGAGCLLCHTTEAGGALTVQQPFGRTVRDDYGVPGANTSALRSALGRMRDDESDSDRDGIADYDELANGTQVNVQDRPSGDPGAGGASGASGGGGVPTQGPPMLSSVPPLETGCSLSLPTAHREWAGLAAVLGALYAVARARRRRGSL